MATQAKRQAHITAKATEWLILLEDQERPVTARQQAAFSSWLRESPEHLKAFFGVADLWQSLEGLDAARKIDVERFGRAASMTSIAPARPKSSAASVEQTFPVRSWMRWAGAAAACALVAITLFLLWPASTELRTGLGEQRTFRLADGSIVQLNTNSRVQILFSDRERRIELMEGEGLFNVEHDTRRPFIVHTATASVRAVGTQFNVHRLTAATMVSVVAGKVEVTSASSGSGDTVAPPSLLIAGEQARVSTREISRQAAGNVPDAVAWRERRLVFKSALLSEVAAEFNRYNTTPIVVDEQLGRSRRLSGIFDADHPQSLLLYLREDPSLTVIEESKRIIIRAKATRNDPPAVAL